MKGFLKTLVIAGLLLILPAAQDMGAGRGSVFSFGSICYGAEQAGSVWRPGFTSFNYLWCCNCGREEEIGMMLACRIAKAWYSKQNFSLSDITFDKDKMMNILSKASKVKVSDMKNFFFGKNKKSFKLADAKSIRKWLNKTYKCSSCGAGDWEYLSISK